MAKKKLTDFLVKLADDPQALANFEKDPDAVIKAAGLSASDATALKNRDAAKIEAAVLAEHPPAGPAALTARPKVKVSITITIEI